jgi:type II secretory pathway component PulJ
MKIGSVSKAAFTVAELLASIAVLALIVPLVAQFMGSATGVVTTGAKHMDADTEARTVLNRMAVDFAAIVKRADIDYYFSKNGGNDQLAFYSETSGYYPSDVTGVTPKSSTCVAGYRILNNQLERLNKALIWNGVSSSAIPPGRPMVFLPQTLTTTWSNIAGGGSDPDYQVIGDQVYRFEFCFFMRDGTLSDRPWLPPQTTFNGLDDVNAIVVAIAVLDTKSRIIAGDLTAATAKLDDVNGTSIATAPAQLWQQKIQNGDLALPRAAASQVRIYQRYFLVNSAK